MDKVEYAVLMVAFLLDFISLLILPYLWYKFWKLRHHFLISARLPKLTLFMSISLYFGAPVAWILSYTSSVHPKEYNIIRPILIATTMTIAFIFVAAIVYRTFLIYELSIKEQHTLNNQSVIIIGGFDTEKNTMDALRDMEITSDNSKHVQHNSHHVLLKRAVIGTILVSFILFCIALPAMAMRIPLARLFPVPFILMIILGVLLLIKARKMKEAMLCRRETYLITVGVFLGSLFNNINLPIYVEILWGGFQGML